MTIYTREHKTSSVGLRREQYLPIAVPWEGISNASWIEQFLDIYSMVGLDIAKRPLGPLLPAPRASGEFCKRPLSTGEAAAWLRALLHGTPNFESIRSHSMKTTLLQWSARAGFDRETRAVLGHHCSALSGSEVVYSRHLQTRALRKLTMMLRRVRIGLGVEEEAMQSMGIPNTPVPFTPSCMPQTPAIIPRTAIAQQIVEARDDGPQDAPLNAAVEGMNVLEDVASVKDEIIDEQAAAEAAGDISTLPLELVASGAIEIDSSSGSDSSYSSDSSDSDSSQHLVETPSIAFEEHVPESKDYYRHVKSGILHSCLLGAKTSACSAAMSSNFKSVSRTFHVRYPKCMKCFPKEHNRIRSRDELISALDAAQKRSRAEP